MSRRDEQTSPTAFITTITRSRRVQIARSGARLTLKVTGRALTERQAREVLEAHLEPGENLLDCIERDGTPALSYSFTFVVWPKATSHTRGILDDLRTAA